MNTKRKSSVQSVMGAPIASANWGPRAAFTLIELLASMAILGLIMVMLFSAFDQINKAWLQGESRVETFTQARAALDFITKELAQAIATTNITFIGDSHNLAFIAPVNGGANAVDLVEVVYRPGWTSKSGVPDQTKVFVDTINTWPTKLVRRTSRFDALPAEGWDYGQGTACAIGPWDFYTISPISTPNPNWPETSVSNQTAVLAENVVSLDFKYVDASGSPPQSYWNSNVKLASSWTRELLTAIPPGLVAGPPGPGGSPVMTNGAPAGVQITIGIIDSKAAIKLKALTPGSAPWNAVMSQATRTFTTFVAIPNRQP